MRKLVAVDPGSTLSAAVEYDLAERRVIGKMKIPNEDMRKYLKGSDAGHLAIEMAESFGAKVWSQVFTTVLWTGRFVESWGGKFTLVTRREVKMALVGATRAKDSQIRNVIIDRWGGKEAAIGTRTSPGPLYGVTADCWQALGVALTYEQMEDKCAE